MTLQDGALFQRLDLSATSSSPSELARCLHQYVPHGVRRAKAKDEAALLDGFARFVGSLILNYSKARGGWSYRSQANNSFSGERVGYKNYVKIRDALEGNGLLEVVYGGNKQAPFEDYVGVKFAPYKAARLRPTAALLEIAKSFGIEPTTVYDHYTDEKADGLPASTKPVVLRSSSFRYRDLKRRGDDLSYAMTPALERMSAQIESLNAFLQTFDITGPAVSGLYRLFGNGDQEDFDWNKGGRLYDRGGYQNADEGERLRMTISGAPVVEIDINASQLTIYAALTGCALSADHDPYDIEGLDRRYVKAWVTATLGHDRFHKQWPPDLRRSLLAAGLDVKGDFAMPAVGSRIMEVHSFLRDRPSTKIDWGDLQFIESEAIFGTMLHLMDAYDIPALPVHDSLIVRQGDMETVLALMMDHYFYEVGAYPRLKATFPDGREVRYGPGDRSALHPLLVGAAPTRRPRLPPILPSYA